LKIETKDISDIGLLNMLNQRYKVISMNCLEIQEYLLDYLDNELSGTYQQAVTEHLQSCLTCREEVESYRKTAVLLQLRGVPEPAAAYWDEAWEKIRDGFKARVVPMHGKTLTSPSRWLWLKRFDGRKVAAVAAVFLLLAFSAWWSWQASQPEYTERPQPSFDMRETTMRPAFASEQDLPEDVRRQIELITASRVAFGSIDPISKSVVLTRIETNGR
jgi:hypothetical protein